MNAKFNIKQVAQIAAKVRQFKKLYVTTNGQMFPREAEANEAVRAMNAILDDHNEYIGVLEMTEDMVTDAKLATFGKNVDPKTGLVPSFAELFKDAKIPVEKKKETQTRKLETPTPEDKSITDSVNASLGINKEETTEKTAPESEKRIGLFGSGK